MTDNPGSDQGGLSPDQGDPRTPSLAPSWLPIGPGTPLDQPDLVPDHTEAWLDLWPAPADPLRRRALRGLVPALVIVLVSIVVVGAAAHAYQDAPSVDRTYLPSDGAYAQVTLNGKPGRLEQGTASGGAFTDLGYFGVVATHGLDNAQARQWIGDHDMWVADAVVGADRVRAVFETSSSGSALVGIAVPGDAALFHPSLPLTGAGAPGSDARTITPSSFTVGERNGPAQVSLTARRDGRCLDWHAQVTSADGHAKPLNLSLRVCRGQGLTAVTFARPGASAVELATTSSDPPHATFAGSLERQQLDAAGVKDWQPRKISPELKDAVGTVPLFATVLVPPAITASGRVLLAPTDGSITAIDIGGPNHPNTTGTVAWVAHPGGVVGALMTIGDLTLVSTSQRKVVAYGPDGSRLWQLEFPDLVSDMTTLDGRLYLATMSGRVEAVDLRTGKQVWRTALDEIQLAPAIAVSSQRVAVALEGGTVVALRTDNGVKLSRLVGSPVNGLDVVGTETLIQRSGQLLRQHTGAGGTSLSVPTGVGSGATMVMAGTLAVASGSNGVACVDSRTGAILARLPTAAGLVAGAGAVAVVGKRSVTVVTEDRPAGQTLALPVHLKPRLVALASWGVVAYDGTHLVVLS